MLTVESARPFPNAAAVRYTNAAEAHQLLQTELERFFALAETLEEDDWNQPTACTAWTVRDILAHQAGGYASGTGYREMFRQLSARPKRGQLPEDALNDFQLSERAGRSPAELLAELRRVAPLGSRKWAYQFRLAKLISIPHPVPGWLSLRHLMWVIHSRDTWMHRLDICRATGRPFLQTQEHDGRIVELVMLDSARRLAPHLKGRSVAVELSGPAGGRWTLGSAEPACTLAMDALDFNIFASGRFSPAEARQRAEVSGDPGAAALVFDNLLVLY